MNGMLVEMGENRLHFVYYYRTYFGSQNGCEFRSAAYAFIMDIGNEGTTRISGRLNVYSGSPVAVNTLSTALLNLNTQLIVVFMLLLLLQETKEIHKTF